MAKKTLILSQKQLDEIVGGNSAYLDNLGNDFAENANNEIYSGDKLDGKDAEPYTTDQHAHERSLDYGPWIPGGRGGTKSAMVYTNGMIACSKKDFERSVINETNSSLINNTYGDDKNRVTNTNASTLKWRYGADKKKAQSSDPTIRQQGISTMKTMEKNNPNLAQIESQYNAAMNNDANLKQSAKNRGQQNVFQKPGGTRNNGGTAHSQKNNITITYNN